MGKKAAAAAAGPNRGRVSPSVGDGGGKRGRTTQMQLCWSCQNAVATADGRRGCEWSRELRPVPGWTAKLVRKAVMGLTWSVTQCPKYTPDGPGKEVAHGWTGSRRRRKC